MNARQRYIDDLQSAWRDSEELEGIVQDGQRVIVPMQLMDAEQRAVAESMPVTQTLAASQQAAERVQAYADHHTAMREQRDTAERAENPAYYDYCQRLQRGEL